jgi:hypothetical protein
VVPKAEEPDVAEVAEVVLVIMVACPENYWPICRVLSSSDLAVFITSTLFW